MKSPDRLLLAGDLGATKTTLALYAPSTWPDPPLRQQTFANREFADFDDLLTVFLGPKPPPLAALCLGVAGPILDGQVRMTNLNWSIAAAALQQRFHIGEVLLINDLVATAAGIPWLAPADLLDLNPGARTVSNAPVAVVAPGSGLGEAFLIPNGTSLLPCASEGGHASFAPRNREQVDLLAFMAKRHGHVSVEQVCCGLAIPELFAFVAQTCPAPDWLQDQLATAADRTPVIIQAALADARGETSCETASQALTLFLDILADEAANLALKTLALGGIYLGGGLMTRLVPLLMPERFMTVFARGTYRDMLARLQVRVILNPQAALLGAAAQGITLLSNAAKAPTRP